MSQENQKSNENITQSSVLSPQSLYPVVHLQNVTKIYGTGKTAVRAVDDVNLRVAAGELILILGPSGAGKTTLLSLIGGLLQPTSGTVHVAGRDLGQLSSAALADVRLRQIGFVFQFFQLFDALTARENVEVPLRLVGHNISEARQQAEMLLERFGLRRRLSHRPQDLSGGEKQRVALARALALRPPLIIADEPTGSLDSRNGEEVIRLLRQLVDEEQRTVLVASHDQRIAQVATRVLQCEDGRLVDLLQTKDFP
jgi:putative ABC transport system ATP-binding protein